MHLEKRHFSSLPLLLSKVPLLLTFTLLCPATHPQLHDLCPLVHITRKEKTHTFVYPNSRAATPDKRGPEQRRLWKSTQPSHLTVGRGSAAPLRSSHHPADRDSASCHTGRCLSGVSRMSRFSPDLLEQQRGRVDCQQNCRHQRRDG